MAIEFACEHCGAGLRVKDDKAGRRAKCPHCSERIQIPDSDDPFDNLDQIDDLSAGDAYSEDEFPTQASVESRPRRRRQMPRGFLPLTVPVWLVTLGTASMFVFYVLAMVATVYQLTLFKQVQRGENVDADVLAASDLYVGGPWGFYGLTFLGTAICWMVWKRRANMNASALSEQTLEYSPGWSIGCYFVPFANIVWPYTAMKEIYYASEPKGTGVSLVGWWWGLWLFSGFVGRVTSGMSRRSETIEDFIRDHTLSLMSAPVDIAVLVVGVLLVWRIRRLQHDAVGID